VTGNVFAERFQFYFLTTNIAIRNNLFPSCYLNAIFPLSFAVMIRRDTFYLSFFTLQVRNRPVNGQSQRLVIRIVSALLLFGTSRVDFHYRMAVNEKKHI